jgi:hypothetical protein
MPIGYYFSCNLFFESRIPDLSVPGPEGKVHVPMQIHLAEGLPELRDRIPPFPLMCSQN